MYADGKALDGLTQTLTKASGWKAEFTKLPGIKDGKKIEYSVVETNTPEGYTSKVEKIDDDNVIKVVNTSNKPTTTTTTTTTTVEPKTSSSTTENPNKPDHSGTTTTPSAPGSNGGNNGGRRKTLLPNTGEVVASGLVFSGILVLAGAVGTKRKLTRQ